MPISLSNIAEVVEEYADYPRSLYYLGPRRFDESTAVLHHVTHTISYYRLGKLLIN